MLKKGGGFLLIILTFILGGCETCKGLGSGLKSLAVDTGKGIKKDCSVFEKMDTWVRENIW